MTSGPRPLPGSGRGPRLPGPGGRVAFGVRTTGTPTVRGSEPPSSAEHSPSQGGAVALPPQVSPPQVAVSDVAPSAVVGADVVAVPVLAGPDGLTLGPGAAELLDELPDDLFALLESCEATGKAGEVVERVVLDTTGLTNGDLRLVLLVGVGEGTPSELRRAGAA